MSNNQIKNADLQKLEKLLQQNKEMYEYISSTYSLKNDLVEVTDGRRATRTLINKELEQIKNHIITDYTQIKNQLHNEIQELRETKESLQIDIQSLRRELDKLEELSEHIAELEKIIEDDDENESTYDQILEITKVSNIDSISEKINQIEDFYTYLFKEAEESTSITKRTKDEIKEIHSKYLEIFTPNDREDSDYDIITNQIEELNELYRDYFESSDEDEKSKKDQLNIFRRDIDQYHERIIGNSDKKIISLESKINNQISRFKAIEEEAKSVIELSSDAGLAGGFVMKVKEAANARLMNLILFIIAIVALFFFNRSLFSNDTLNTISWDSFLFKIFLNAPLIWLATITNINFNRFNRLEQEYSHKEALARSFERYKLAIQDLTEIDEEQATNLQIKLMDICLDAFKVNPAETSEKIKADIDILDMVRKNLPNSKKVEE